VFEFIVRVGLSLKDGRTDAQTMAKTREAFCFRA